MATNGVSALGKITSASAVRLGISFLKSAGSVSRFGGGSTFTFQPAGSGGGGGGALAVSPFDFGGTTSPLGRSLSGGGSPRSGRSAWAASTRATIEPPSSVQNAHQAA